MYRNKQLTLDGVFGYNRLLVNGVDVAPTLNTNTQDISYIYNEALINTSNDILSTAKITEAVSSLTQTNTQDIKAIKTSLKEHIDNVKNNYLQRGQDIRFNTNIAKFSFPSSFPTTAINNNNTGIGWFWNWSGGAGETDLICYGQASSGGLSIYGGGNTTNPNSSLICKLWPNNIYFTSTPTFPTTQEIGNYGATTKYVDDRLSTQGGNINLNDNAKLSFPTSYPGIIPVNNNNAGIGFYWNSDGHGETDLICYGRTSPGGLTISAANNTSPPLQICTFRRDYIGFTFAPHFVTTEEIGNVGATTQYVDDRIKELNNGTNLTIIQAQQTSNNNMITNLSNQVLALQTTVQANNATISRLTTDITALNAKVYALIEEIDKINSL